MGKKALLVGAATGIGMETALKFAEEGADLVIGDINVEGGMTLASSIAQTGRKCRFLEVDVRQPNKVENFVAEAVSILGGLDILVNLAGIQRSGAIEDFSMEEWELTFDINIRSQFLIIKYALPSLKESGYGSIVNMASAGGIKGGPGMSVYSASKGAVIAFSRTLSVELAPANIRVNSVSPGWIDTPFNAPAIKALGGQDKLDFIVRSQVPLQRQGLPVEVARTIAFLASDEASFITGQSIVIDGGMI
jgi:NAD(P)-dependent dehydrogenase (short-subunit alcohol dehydrogenase family)